MAAAGEARQALARLLGRWEELKGKEVKALNERLREAGLPALGPDTPPPDGGLRTD